LRKFLLAATSSLALALPAFAQNAPVTDGAVQASPDAGLAAQQDEDWGADARDASRDSGDDRIERALPPRGEIEAMGDVASRTVDAVLDVPIGPIVEAANPGRRLSRREREETLGDRASRNDPYFRDRVRSEIGSASVGVNAAMRQIAILTPVIQRTMEDAARRIEDAVRDGRRYDPED
jgi:hypothetical protein